MNRVAMTTRRHEPGPATTDATVSVESALTALLANPAIAEPLRNALREAAHAGAGHDARDPPATVTRMLAALQRLDADSDTLVAAVVHGYPVLQQRLGPAFERDYPTIDRKSPRRTPVPNAHL